MTDYKNLKLIATSNPHIRSSETTRSIMLDVIIAMVPALIWAVISFGVKALTLTVVSVLGCMFWEWLYRKLMKQHQTVGDLSAVVTGMLIAFVCPVTLPYWTIIIGDFFAIIIIKMLFGGIGRNIINPALGGRAFMMSWALLMSTWIKVGFENAAPILGDTSLEALDGMTAATPMSFMHQGALPNVSVMDAFLGNVGGCIGETSALALLIGLVYLLVRRVITLRIPLTFIGTVAILSFLFPQGNDNLTWMSYQVLCGGLLLGAIFMATDYVTSPLTKLGQIGYGIGCGLLTFVIRYFGGYPEGVSYAILIMNCCVVLFDRIGRSKKFGSPKKVKKEVAKA